MDVALELIREQIRTGVLGPGDRIRLSDLKDELGMSPTPIREALRILQADGLVRFLPHQGIVVAHYSADETADTARIRCALESLATRLAVPNLTARDIRELEELHGKLMSASTTQRGTSITSLNSVWHARIYHASNSKHLTNLIEHLWAQYPWRTIWALPGRAEQSAAEHKAIMEAIVGGDAELAAARMGNHIETGLEALLAKD